MIFTGRLALSSANTSVMTEFPISTLFEVTAVPTSVPDENAVAVTSRPPSL